MNRAYLRAHTSKNLKKIASRLAIFTFILGSLAGCAGGQLTVESDPPGADIFVVASGGVKQKLGVTPMILTPSLQPTVFAPDAQIQISKSSYRSESFLIPPQAGGAVVRIQAKLSDDLMSKTCENSANSLTEATDAIAQIQRTIYKKNYPEAERALMNAISKYPSVPAFHSLLGNVYYLQRNLDKALEAYQRSNALQPQNGETSRMIEKIRGIRMPSGGGT
jgi:tetratricopeptide (TPR) repeat protein